MSEATTTLSMCGKIIAVLSERELNTKNGVNKIKEYVIEEVEGQYPKKMCFEIYGTDRIQKFNLQLGDLVEICFNVDAREYQGRWFNSIRAWKVNKLVAEVQDAPEQLPQRQAQQLAQQQAPVKEEQKSVDVSDLPF